MSDMGWSRYIRDLDKAADLEEQARRNDMLPHLAKYDYDSPHEMYRVLYKYTDCGPWMSIKVNGQWVHCQDLHKLGTWQEMVRRGDIVEEVLIGSIVEGSDAEPAPVSLRLSNLMSRKTKSPRVTRASLSAAIDAAVRAVNDEACALWNEANEPSEEDS